MKFMEERPIFDMNAVDGVPTWIIDSLKDVQIELMIVCPAALFRRLEFAARVIEWAAKLTGIRVKLTVRLNP